MPPTSNLIGTATRYIAGRNAVQTVYWKTCGTDNQKLLKLSKTCNFGRAPSPPQKVRELQQDYSQRGETAYGEMACGGTACGETACGETACGETAATNRPRRIGCGELY
ncbi:unnamed protein product [Ceutorhynchus assimilis]|uniref:Uncharacterized protein n=1 Tax=Ceutorhynchus assimilis TaxID=467358 RepID=A0A9N9MSU5_9CUCU|nr:unnamed protein product [Ceutorhynchus assimilis]